MRVGRIRIDLVMFSYRFDLALRRGRLASVGSASNIETKSTVETMVGNLGSDAARSHAVLAAMYASCALFSSLK